MAGSDNKSLISIAEEKNSTNPTQIGDPISLKAETSNNEPTDQDRPNKMPVKREGHKSLKQKAQEELKHNPSALGDPVSLKAEKSNSEPTKDDRGTLGVNEPKSRL